MSLRTLVRRRGSVATLYRATKTFSASGAANASFAAVATGVRVLLDVPDAAVVERIFGQGARCDLRAIALKDVPVQDGGTDGVSITAGWRAGEHYDVARVMDFDQGRRHAHWEIALVRRPGAFA